MNHSKMSTGAADGVRRMGDENQPCLSPITDDQKENLKNTNKQNVNSSGNIPLNEKLKRHLRENLLLVLTIIAIILGITIGFLGRINKPSATVLTLISFPGEMLLRILKMLILPLIISSLITGLAQLDPKSSGKLGSRAIGFYFSTTVLATATGIIMGLIVHPGKEKKDKTTGGSKPATQAVSTLDALLDIIRNMFPENIVQACSQQLSTVYKSKQIIENKLVNDTNTSVVTMVVTRELKYVDGTNVMGLVVFCIIFGIFISHSKSEAQILYDFFYVMNELIMKIIALIMWYSPFGILCLVSSNIIKIENMAETARRLSIYMFTVILGLIIHALITFQLLYFVTTRKNPFKFLKGMLQAWLTAVGTASSSATLPITFRCLEVNNKVDKRVTRFMLPLGATINMDGTALYQCVATIFIAQLNGIKLTIGQLIAVSLASTATSIGVAAIPSAALVTLLIVLSTVGLPSEDISYIVTVDWLLDRLRTSINVLGDAYGCGIVEHLSRHELKKLDEEAENQFAQIISSNVVDPQQQQQLLMPTSGANVDENFVLVSNQTSNPLLSICDERKLSIQKIPSAHSVAGQQYTDYKEFDDSRRRASQTNQQMPSGVVIVPQQPAVPQEPPSIVVMDAVRRRSRAMLFSNKVPTSVNSMPQISQYSNTNNNNNNQNNNNTNNNGVNQDSNV